MAVIRQFNFLGQMRIDTPHLISLESAICNDFDILAGKILGGKRPLIVKGFVIPTTNAAGSPASSLQLVVADGLLIHFGASTSGSMFSVPDNEAAQTLTATNSKVSGAFVSNTTNYVGLDLIRSADSTTSDLVQFLDSDTDQETPQTVPLARTLQYKIVISTQNFSVSPTLVPIAKIQTDSSNNVVSIQDCRSLFYRLGSGGDTAQANFTYGWGTRTENSITYSSGGADSFVGEDKSISSFKSWMDAVMTSIWELRGGERWYSAQHRDNIKVLYGPVATLADNFTFATPTLRWEAISIAFENAETKTPAGTPKGVYYNTVANNTTGVTLNDGQCLYVDVTRESNAANIPAFVTNLVDLGSSTTPGRRFVLAWRVGASVFTRDRPYEIGRNLLVASDVVLGVVKLSRAASTPTSPIVISDTGGTVTSPGGGLTALTANGTGANSSGILAQAGGTGAYGVLAAGGTAGIGIRASGSVGGEFLSIVTNGNALTATGNGTGYGGVFTSGSGVGLKSTGGGTAMGIEAIATGNYAVSGTSTTVAIFGSSSGTYGVGGQGVTRGGSFLATGASSSGAYGQSTGADGIGVEAFASGTGSSSYGVKATSTNGTGVIGIGNFYGGNFSATNANGHGVLGTGNGTGTGVIGQAGTGGGSYGVLATAGAGVGSVGLRADTGGVDNYGAVWAIAGHDTNSIFAEKTVGTGAATAALKGTSVGYALWVSGASVTPVRAAVHIEPQGADPTTLQDGDMWITGGVLKIRLGGITKTVNTTP